MKDSEIEDTFSTAVSVRFIIDKENLSSLVLVYDTMPDFSGYNYMLNSFDRKDVLLLISLNTNGLMDLSIIDKHSNTVVNANNLPYDRDEYEEFNEVVKPGQGFVFAFGSLQEGKAVLYPSTHTDWQWLEVTRG